MREVREHQSRELYRRVGRIAVEVTCPFCGNGTQGFVWSLAGSGKRCRGRMPDGSACQALHSLRGSIWLPRAGGFQKA